MPNSRFALHGLAPPYFTVCAPFFVPLINSVQTRCIVKGEAQKSPLFWRFSGSFCFSQDRLFSRNSTRKPLNLIKSPIFTNAPCETACLYNAPSMHTIDLIHGLYAFFKVLLTPLSTAPSPPASQFIGFRTFDFRVNLKFSGAISFCRRAHVFVSLLSAVPPQGGRVKTQRGRTTYHKYPFFRTEKAMTATDVPGLDAIFSTGFFPTFSRF